MSDFQFDGIANALIENGFVVVQDAVPAALLVDLQTHVVALKKPVWFDASVGRDSASMQNASIRFDQISWLTSSHEVENDYLRFMETVREGLNARLFLGLFDFESHFASFAPGAFYQKHLDALKGRTNRRLSTVLYLNDDWQDQDGGALQIYGARQDKVADALLKSVFPRRGTLVIFLSEDIPHEVLPALRQRWSIAGWFRVNGSRSSRVDPAF